MIEFFLKKLNDLKLFLHVESHSDLRNEKSKHLILRGWFFIIQFLFKKLFTHFFILHDERI